MRSNVIGQRAQKWQTSELRAYQGARSTKQLTAAHTSEARTGLTVKHAHSRDVLKSTL